MIIKRVEIKDYLVFKSEFAADFCPGVNVLIGGNGTGKTTLIREMYKSAKAIKNYHVPSNLTDKALLINYDENHSQLGKSCGQLDGRIELIVDVAGISYTIYIPEKDIFEHATGLLPFIKQRETGFSQIYEDILLAGQVARIRDQSATQKSVGQKIAKIIDGEVYRNEVDGSFYTLKTDGTRVPFEHEASGYKRIGFLGLLVSRGLLEPGTVLFWDEPENSLNPELVPDLVDILLELSRSGVQIFIATHDYLLPKYLEVRRKTEDDVWFHFLSKTGFNQPVTIESDTFFSAFENNNIINQPIRLYEETHKEGMG